MQQLGGLPGGTGTRLMPVPVCMWPQATPRWQAGILLLGLRHAAGTTRDAARTRVRQVLLQLLEVPGCSIEASVGAGQAPQIQVPGHARAGLSISHDGDFSVAAVHLHGPVGVDVMAVQDTADWRGVASDYLGPQVLARLCAANQAQRARLFARAWCEREARLKCAGLGLSEWSPQSQPPARTLELALPAGLVGALALPV